MRKKKPITYYAASLVRDDDIIIGAGDTETAGLGGRLLMVQWGIMGNIWTATGPDMVARFFCALLDYPKPCVWFFHFGQYDWRYFLQYIIDNNLQCEIGLRTETDIYEIRVRKSERDKWSIMRDSYALWPNTLRELAESFCPEIPKLNIEIEDFDPDNADHVAYAKRDVEILLKGMPRLYAMLRKHFNVTPSATTAGTALRAWQKSLPRETIYDAQKWGPSEVFIRQGYYGGLVFLTSNVEHHDVVTYDVNSSYPASMIEYGVPCGNPIYTRDFESDNIGFYRVRVRTPDDLVVPILPARNANGVMRWYKGEFETVVTSQELQFAVLHGYKILQLFEGYAFDRVEYPFTDLINHCRFIRKNFKGQPEEKLAKLIQNSLYGKFASRRERLKMLAVNTADENDLLGCVPYDSDGFWYVKKEFDENMRCIPQWAAYITANSRLRLLKTIYNIGPENVLYGDTDSITVKRGFESQINIGPEYGQFKLEKEWSVFRAIAPKVYVGILARDIKGHPAGSYYGAAKGLPRKGVDDSQWRELLQTGITSASTLSLQSLRVAFKTRTVTSAKELIRESSRLENSQNFIALNGNVRVKSAS